MLTIVTESKSQDIFRFIVTEMLSGEEINQGVSCVAGLFQHVRYGDQETTK